jgi:transcriptional regulator with XRE-family HTH domain
MLGWTQDELAVRSGVAKRSIAGFELEIVALKPETMQRLVACLSAGGIKFRNANEDVVTISLRKSVKSRSAPTAAFGGAKRLKAGSVRARIATSTSTSTL